MALNALGERLMLQKNVKYKELKKKWSAISVPRTVPELCFIRSAVGKLNKIVDKHFFFASAEFLLCRRVREAKNQLCVALLQDFRF